jgi:hypothetical protein
MVRLVIAGSLLLALLAASTTRCEAWVASQGIGSKFAGAVLQERVPSSITTNNQKCVLEMKKGQKVPLSMRSEYKKNQQNKAMQAQMQEAQKAGEDGFPVFNLFVRSRLANVSLTILIIHITHMFVLTPITTARVRYHPVVVGTFPSLRHFAVGLYHNLSRSFCPAR